MTLYTAKIKKILNNRYLVHLLALAFFTLVSGLLVIRLGQDVNYDLLNYHYYNPYAFLNGLIDRNVGVSGILSYENPIRDIPAYLIMSNFSPKHAGFLLGAIQGINLWLVFEILFLLLRVMRLRRLISIALSFLVACLTLFGTGFHSEIGGTMGDNTTSILVLSALFLLLYSNKNNQLVYGVSLYRVLAFILIGFSTGVKLTNMTYLLGMLLAGLALSNGQRIKERAKQLFVDGGAATLGVMAIAGFWYVKVWSSFGSPIYPFYNGVFKSEYYPVKNFVDPRWINDSLWSSITEPFSYFTHQMISSEVAFQDPRIPMMIIAILLIGSFFVVAKLKSTTIKWNSELSALLVFIVVSYLIWAVQFSYYRYLMVVELLSLPIIAITVLVVMRKSWLSFITLFVVGFLIVTNTTQTSWGRIPWQPTNFGVTTKTFEHLENSTVLIAGYQPYAFLVPYFPDTTQVLRVQSDLTSPEMGTSHMQGLITKRIESAKQKRTEFFVLQADEEQEVTRKTVKHFGFIETNCKELPVTIRNHTPQKYRLCELVID